MEPKNTVWDRLEVQNEELMAAVQQLKPKARFIVTGYVLKGKHLRNLLKKRNSQKERQLLCLSIEKLRIKMEKK